MSRTARLLSASGRPHTHPSRGSVASWLSRPVLCASVLLGALVSGCGPDFSWTSLSPTQWTGPCVSESDADPVALWCRRAMDLRGLRFERAVRVRPLARSDVAAAIRADIESTLPLDEIEAYRDAYVALGLLPEGIDLIEVLSLIYGDELAGRYVASESALYLVEGATPGGYSRETVAVHELVHALQHQRYPRLFELVERLRHNDDLVSAVAGVIEGDASFTMFGADSLDPSTDRDLASARSFRDGMLLALRYPTGNLGQAPELIRVSVIFPYAYGTLMAAHRYIENGNPGLDALLEDVPLSTLDLLESDAGPREPLRVDFVELPLERLEAALAPAGCRLGHDNVAGVLGLRALFDDYTGTHDDALLAAWRGDRFVHIPCEQDGELLWFIRFGDETSAEAFLRAYLELAPRLAERAPLTGIPRAERSERSVVIYTPGLRDVLPVVSEETRVRSFARLESWMEAGCPGEPGGCPVQVETADGGVE